MSSTFFGLNIGASALNAYSASINTTANNVANANTVGYSKQVANLEALSALRNYTYGTLGSGVTAESITQLRNTYYDVKYWANNSNSGQYEKKQYYMYQIQNLFTESDKVDGFTSIFNSMFNVLESMKGSAADLDLRNHFIHNTQSFMEYFNSMATNLQDIQSDCNQEVRSIVSQINSYAQKISVINDKINVIEIQGGHANELRDQRAVLIDELSALVPVETEELDVKNSKYPDMYLGGTLFRIRVQGQLLVDGSDYNELECYSREDKFNQNDIKGLYDIRWKDTGNEFSGYNDTMSGQLKAVFDIRDGNNKENFQGTLETLDGTTVIVKDPNLTTIEAWNMPPSGQIMIGNKSYRYKSFEMKVNQTSGECKFEFEMEDDELSSIASKAGKEVRIGNTVDSRGIPYYLSQMNEFLRSFSRKMNEIQASGTDLNGDAMGTYIIANRTDGSEAEFKDLDNYRSDADNYYYMTASNTSVNAKTLHDPNIFATSVKPHVDASDVDEASLINQMLELQDKTVVYRGSGGRKFLEYITTDISIDTQEAEILYSNYSDISNTIDTYRMSVSSVDEDEEGMDLLKFQNAYNLASRIISTLNEMYDRLITQTGV